MTTAVPGSTYTNSLPAGQTLTVVTTTGTALIERKSPALTSQEKTPVTAGATVTLGPYLVTCSMRVIAFGASCDVSMAQADSPGGAASAFTLAEVAAQKAAFAASGISVRARPYFFPNIYGRPDANKYTPGSFNTFIRRISVPFKPVAFRVVLYNCGAAPTADIVTKVGFASSADLAVTSPAGTGVAPTWGPQGRYSGPVAAGMFSGTPATAVPLLEPVVSELTFFGTAPLARTDGGTGYIIESRAGISPTTPYNLASNDANPPSPIVQYQGGVAGATPVHTGTIYSGDGVTNWPAIVGSSANNSYVAMDVILYSEADIYNVAICGDSLNGQYTPDSRSSDAYLACLQLTADGVLNANCSRLFYPTYTSANYYQNAMTMLRNNLIPLQILFYTPESPNDGSYIAAPGTALNAQIVGQVMSLKQECDRRGVVLVLCSSAPYLPANATEDANHQAVIAQMKVLAANMGSLYIDRYAVWTDGNVPARIKTIYGVNDSDVAKAAHENILAFQATMPLFYQAIRTISGK